MIVPFVANQTYVAASVAFVNGENIADDVLPYVPVYTPKFAYNLYDFSQGMTVPETKVGRKGTPNQVDFKSTEEVDQVEDHGLDSPVPNVDVEAWEGAVKAGNKFLPDPRILAAEETTGLVLLGREVRAASIVFNPNTYGVNNKKVLSGESQWDHPDNETAEADIANALDSMVMRGNEAVFGRITWSRLQRNLGLRARILGSTKEGMITRQQFADHFELRKVHVGTGFVNIAAKGQAPQRVRVWGNHAAFLHQNKVSSTQAGVTFGFTAQWGGWIGGDIPDPNMGVRGGTKVRVAQSVKEKVVAPDLGYLFINAVGGA